MYVIKMISTKCSKPVSISRRAGFFAPIIPTVLLWLRATGVFESSFNSKVWESQVSIKRWFDSTFTMHLRSGRCRESTWKIYHQQVQWTPCIWNDKSRIKHYHGKLRGKLTARKVPVRAYSPSWTARWIRMSIWRMQLNAIVWLLVLRICQLEMDLGQ